MSNALYVLRSGKLRQQYNNCRRAVIWIAVIGGVYMLLQKKIPNLTYMVIACIIALVVVYVIQRNAKKKDEEIKRIEWERHHYEENHTA